MCYKSWWKGRMKAIIQGLKEHQQLSTKRMNCKCGLNNTFPRNQTKYKRSSLNFHQVTWFELVEQEVHFPEALDKHTQKNYSKVRQRFATIPATYMLEDFKQSPSNWSLL